MSAGAGSVSRMEWIATGIAVLAALVAGWQAVEARRSRLDARTSAAEAQQHEERAVTASERIASAVEEQNEHERAAREQERAERERYKNPWTRESQVVASGRAWKFHLGGDEPVTGVAVKIDDKYGKERLNVTMPDTENMRPGQSFRLDWWQSMASPSQITAELHWVRSNGDAHDSVMTLD